MRAIVIGLAALGGAAGVYAAALWFRSSKLYVTPAYAKHGGIEPVDDSGRVSMDWIVGINEFNDEVAKLNALAARWTAGSVLLGSLASILSAACL